MIGRRELIRHLGLMSAAPLFMRTMSAEAATASSNLIVVAIALNGGNDGLNTVIPLTQYGTYNTLRTPSTGTIAFTQAQLAATAFNSSYTTAAGSATQFAFSPAMTTMRSLYAGGHLAVITGIGLPLAENFGTSHANAYSDWMTGQINAGAASSTPPGWLAAALSGQSFGPLGPTASTMNYQQIIVGNNTPGLVVGTTLGAFKVSPPNYSTTSAMTTKLIAELSASSTSSAELAQEKATTAALAQMGTLQTISTGEPLADYPVVQSYLDSQLKTIAQLILGGSGVRGYVASQYGYDTHQNQNAGNLHENLLSTLSYSLNSFYTYLQSKSASSNVLMVTLSDFGRKPNANATLGTDHGAASVAFVLGDMVKGGTYGNYPSLTTFNPQGNLTVAIDFRNMLSDIIVAMGGNATTVLGTTYPSLGFL
jgi:uncharacterized protein (DUF1501 family)